MGSTVEPTTFVVGFVFFKKILKVCLKNRGFASKIAQWGVHKNPWLKKPRVYYYYIINLKKNKWLKGLKRPYYCFIIINDVALLSFVVTLSI